LGAAAHWNRDQFATPLYGTDDTLRVVKYPIGKGEVIWWASATPLTNAGLREPGNMEFFLACVGNTDRPVLWDEYFHGYREEASAPIAAPVRWIGGELLLMAAAVLMTYSRRSGPIVSPPIESRASPLEFVRTLGSL